MARKKLPSLAEDSPGASLAPGDHAGLQDGAVNPRPAPSSPAIALDEFGLPPRVINGQPNATYYREAYALINRMMMRAVQNGDKIPFNYESAINGMDKEAKAAGFDPKVVRDQRTPDQVIDQAIDRLCESRESALELADSELDLLISTLEQRMDAADRLVNEQFDDRIRDADSRPKAWAERLKRIKRLRQRAKYPSPFKTRTPKALRLEGAHVLRLMVYVGRSNLAQVHTKSPADAVYLISHHHAKMSLDVWQARNCVRWGPARSDPHGPSVANLGESPYKGAVLVIGPGHGKTDFGRYFVASEIAKNPHTQAMLNHAQGDKARENLAYLASLFTNDTPAGRRFYSLFGLELEKNNVKEFRLKLPDRLKAPTATASGVNSKISGSNASLQWWDDPVDQSEIDSETQRHGTFNTLNGTWLTRMRGSDGTFLLITATLWHLDDAVSRYIQMARDGKMFMRVSRQPCGGPKSSPAFFPIWPEMYPARELRAKYQSMQNPGLYSAAYMCDPSSDETKIVKKLRLYDPNTEEHVQFMENSTKHMSLDPAATRGERADLAGVVYAGLGSVRTEREVDGRKVTATEKRLRMIEVTSIPATQAELVIYTVNLCKVRSVDSVMVETRSGFNATADMFENYHGIPVTRLDPKNKNKEERLRAAAPAVENANSDLGIWAVVEFPGVFNDKGEWVIDPRFEQLANEILTFGVCATDHILDAFTQMVIYFTPELGIGTGGVVSKIARHEADTRDPRIRGLLKEWAKPKNSQTIEDETAQWLAKNWSMPEPTTPNSVPVGMMQ